MNNPAAMNMQHSLKKGRNWIRTILSVTNGSSHRFLHRCLGKLHSRLHLDRAALLKLSHKREFDACSLCGI